MRTASLARPIPSLVAAISGRYTEVGILAVGGFVLIALNAINDTLKERRP